MNQDEQSRKTDSKNKGTGINIRAGDRVYIPAGGLQLSLKEDGTVESSVFLAIDPWLPDFSANGVTPSQVVESIIKQGFPVSSICGDTLNACQRSYVVRTLLAHPEVSRLRYIVVVDGNSVFGVLDLDKARREAHSNPGRQLLVEHICEPISQHNCIQGDTPLLDYLLTADEQPFRVVRLTGDQIRTVDVGDLQKLPVRILLFTKFSHLETLLARQLCIRNPRLLEIAKITEGPAASSLGSLGSGPERRIERLYFKELLSKASQDNLISIDNDEIEFLVRYRNNVAHGPRWYITRRQEVSTLVNCVRRLSGLINELDVIPDQRNCP